MNHEQVGKHAIQCFRHATYRMSIFNIACVGACKCDRTPFVSRPGSFSNRIIATWKFLCLIFFALKRMFGAPMVHV